MEQQQTVRRTAASIGLIDDMFPQVLSAFRFEEFLCYLDEFPGLNVYTTGRAFSFANDLRPIPEVARAFDQAYPQFAGRLRPLDRGAMPRHDLYYSIFLSNIFEHLDIIERDGAPFVFTLYPGGGFALDRADSDAKLARVFSSPSFRHVIVTQPIIRDYLLFKRLCPPEQMVELFGGVMPRTLFDAPPVGSRLGPNKPGADICFVACRYSPTGADKGYDLFVEAARLLVAAGLPATFHVVGQFDPSIVDLGAAAPHFRFYGLQPTSFFPRFYARMDAFVSANRPFVLAPGAFDGFPTGACIEAGLQGVAMLCTDELGLNVAFRDGEDFCLIQPDGRAIAQRLCELIEDPPRLARLGRNARTRMMQYYCWDRQIRPRIDLLRCSSQERRN